MPQITISDLSFTYEGSYDPIFAHVSLQLDTSWKLGLIGRNGRGKTTLLRLLEGRLSPTGGTVSLPERCHYFPYEVPFRESATLDVLQQVCPQAADWELLRELSRLEVADDALYRPFSTLSNGERTKALLAALFLKGGDGLVLLDEPTNHLDQQSRGILGNYLSRKQGFILASHDRTLLDACIDHTLSIERSTIRLQKGNYSSWQQNKDREDQFELAQNEKYKQEIRRLQAAAQRTHQWSDAVERTKNASRNSGLKPDKGYIGHKAAKMMQRSKTIQSRQQKAVEEKSKLLHNLEDADALLVRPLPHHKQTLLQAEALCLYYGERLVCGPLTFSVKQGERVALCGHNGSGKSTLLRLALGQSISYTGHWELAPRLTISYVPQDASFLEGDLLEFAQSMGVEATLLLTILRKLGFERVQFEKDLSQLSMGQQKKVLLAASLCTQAHLYIWDEPLNYIDLLSRVQVEGMILQSQPTMLFVDHDSAFLNQVATKQICLD